LLKALFSLLNTDGLYLLLYKNKIPRHCKLYSTTNAMASSLLSSLAFLITATIVIANPTVTISSGVVIGTTVTPDNQQSATAVVNAFLGIPFAKSPPQRFSPPEAPEPWSTPLQAQSLAPSCPQQNISG
jgi:acetylcholinesterase/carboxylesterase 2